MNNATPLIIAESLKKWLTAPGFLMVLAVAFIPPVLTAAWVTTHQADIEVTDLTWDLSDPEDGDLVNLSATVTNIFDEPVDAFNVTIRIGFYEQRFDQTVGWRDFHNESRRVDGLGPDESTTVTINWTAEAGTYQVEAYADFFADEIAEIEELNNYRPDQIQVRYPSLRPQVQQPPPAGNESELVGPEVDANMTEVVWRPDRVFEGDNMSFDVTVSNRGPGDLTGGTVTLQVLQLSLQGVPSTVLFDDQANVSAAANGSATVSFTWPEVDRGLFAVAAFLDTSLVAHGDNVTDNVIVQQFDVQRKLIWEEPEERATAKDFYRQQVLLPLHFTLLVPLIGLFYAGGVLNDDRARGNLVYMLTRPVPRWTLPIARFSVSFLVALVAVLIGVAATYLLLLGTPRANPAYFWWPLVFGVMVLFLYGSVFTLVGVMTERPYLVGLLYVLGFETMVLAGRRILVNGEPLVQDWVLRLSLNHWVMRAFDGWDPTLPFQFLPVGGEAVRAFWAILGIGVVALAGSAVAMQRREFHG